MNLKTTIILALLVGAGTGAWLWLDSRKPAAETACATLDFLQTKLTLDKLTRVEVTRRPKKLDLPRHVASVVGSFAAPLDTGNRVTSSTLQPQGPMTVLALEKIGSEWTLPGNWPVRPQETEQWLGLLTSLRSRFAPIYLTGKVDLAPYGIEEDGLTIKVTVGDETQTLRFGEDPNDSNRFTRSTFLRLGSEGEVIQLGPGVFASLNRSAEHFRQRRLFPQERVAKDEASSEKVEQLAASAVDVQTKDAKFAMVKKGSDWVLRNAQKKKEKDWQVVFSEDRIDPAKRDALLRGFTDLWAEKFVDNKSLDECGLRDPEFVVSATKDNGAKISLLVGKVSHSEVRFDKKPGPPGMPPKMMREEYRFAKLGGNDQLFEIKADKLSDIVADLDELRDPQLARFKTADVKRFEMRLGGQDIVLVRAKEAWRFEKPSEGEAETKTVEEVLEKLAALQTRDKDIHDGIDAKTVGLDKPNGRIKITLEEADKDAKKTREIMLYLGTKEKEDDKLYVRLDGWPRINQVGGELRKLVSRTDLAYRPRELWRVERDAITRITIQADGVPYHLNRENSGWKISGPLEAEAATKDMDALAEELSHLQAERFETNHAKDLAQYGLDKPAFKISLTAKDGKPRAVEIGKAADGGRFARLASADAVFVLSDKLLTNVRRDPFDILDKNLWELKPETIQRIRFQGLAPFTLEAGKGQWKVLDAPVPAFNADERAIKKSVSPLLQLRAERYAAFGGKIDWAKFGLDKPAVTITLTSKIAETEKTADHVLELGNAAPGGGRYARLDKKDAAALLDAETAEELQLTYLDFVDPRVLKFDGDSVVLIERKMKDADLDITRREENWLITKPGTRDADILTIVDVLRRTSQLQAKRIAAFPPKDLQPFGLDNPAAVITLNLEFDGNTSKHVIKLGNLVKDAGKKDTDERYALIDERKMVVVLSAELSRALVAPALYFADRNLASFSNVDRAELTRGSRKAVFSRSDGNWKMVQPTEAPADDAALGEMIRSLQRLRADEIVADKGADLKKYGLDQPFLQWRLKSGETEQLNLIVGAAENDQPGARRYAKLGDKNQVFLLNSKVTAKVQSEVRSLRAWTPFDQASATKLTITAADKSFTLNRKGAKWEMADDPKANVNEVAVTNALNILESLKAASWIADAKTDLKPYGLDKPSWKIEIDLPKEKLVLLLGGLEDKSKRMYATLPATGAVFVIDEIDAMILARPRLAYVEAEKKK